MRDRPVVLGLTALAGIAPFAVLNIWLLSASESVRVVDLAVAHGSTLGDAPLTVVLAT